MYLAPKQHAHSHTNHDHHITVIAPSDSGKAAPTGHARTPSDPHSVAELFSRGSACLLEPPSPTTGLGRRQERPPGRLRHPNGLFRNGSWSARSVQLPDGSARRAYTPACPHCACVCMHAYICISLLCQYIHISVSMGVREREGAEGSPSCHFYF